MSRPNLNVHSSLEARRRRRRRHARRRTRRNRRCVRSPAAAYGTTTRRSLPTRRRHRRPVSRAWPLYGQWLTSSVGTSRSMRTSTFGRYQRGGRPVSYSTTRAVASRRARLRRPRSRTAARSGGCRCGVYGLRGVGEDLFVLLEPRVHRGPVEADVIAQLLDRRLAELPRGIDALVAVDAHGEVDRVTAARRVRHGCASERGGPCARRRRGSSTRGTTGSPRRTTGESCRRSRRRHVQTRMRLAPGSTGPVSGSSAIDPPTLCPCKTDRCRSGIRSRACASCACGLPEVNERLSHGAPTWFIRDKKTFATVVGRPPRRRPARPDLRRARGRAAAARRRRARPVLRPRVRRPPRLDRRAPRSQGRLEGDRADPDRRLPVRRAGQARGVAQPDSEPAAAHDARCSSTAALAAQSPSARARP